MAAVINYTPSFYLKSLHPENDHLLVCLPPAGGSSNTFDPLTDIAQHLGLEVLSIDFPGAGRRRRSQEERALEDPVELAHDLVPWLEHHLRRHDGSVRPFSIVGISLGGMLGFWLAEERLLPRGLVPKNIVAIMSQPVHVKNRHTVALRGLFKQDPIKATVTVYRPTS